MLAALLPVQAGLPTDATELTGHYRRLLTEVAADVDVGYPGNADLVLEGGRPVLRRRRGAERSKEALPLEEAVHDRLPRRDLPDLLFALPDLAPDAFRTRWAAHDVRLHHTGTNNLPPSSATSTCPTRPWNSPSTRPDPHRLRRPAGHPRRRRPEVPRQPGRPHAPADARTTPHQD
ncbi:hypothetical protein [Streptosporangium roseum]|uniref:hypothetical protein n=1 Tax=Streptosporangium roseum TaxID=2001 RepID=UPI0012DD5D08|nr:hypothetical protein [Streptosporangium roseum]